MNRIREKTVISSAAANPAQLYWQRVLAFGADDDFAPAISVAACDKDKTPAFEVLP
jgi:hypothetical protein